MVQFMELLNANEQLRCKEDMFYSSMQLLQVKQVFSFLADSSFELKPYPSIDEGKKYI